MKKERLVEFDTLRGLAFIFIVLQHSVGGFSFREDINIQDLFISKLMYTIAEVATPLFVCLTAVALLYTYYDKFDIKNFYIKKMKFLVMPFILWSIFIICYNNENINYDIILTIFSGSAQYHLWYMGMILRLYLYFPLILLFVRHINKEESYIKTLYFLFFTLCNWYMLSNQWILDTIARFIFKNPTELQDKIIAITPLIYYFYFVIGAYLILNYKSFKESILKYKYIVIIMYFIGLAYYYYIEIKDRIGDPFPYIKNYTSMSIFYKSISILFFYIIAYYITTKFRYVFKLFEMIGKYSFPAYLIHVLILNKLTRYIPVTQYLSCAIKYLLLTVAISISICYVLNYLPYSEYLIGNKSKFNMNKLINMLKRFWILLTRMIFPRLKGILNISNINRT